MVRQAKSLKKKKANAKIEINKRIESIKQSEDNIASKRN